MGIKPIRTNLQQSCSSEAALLNVVWLEWLTVSTQQDFALEQILPKHLNTVGRHCISAAQTATIRVKFKGENKESTSQRLDASRQSTIAELLVNPKCPRFRVRI
jgi:hypothetical protein